MKSDSNGLLIRNNVSLKKFNTLGIDLVAKFFVEAHTGDDVAEAVAFAQLNNLQLLVLGGGSNLVFLTATLDTVLVLKLSLDTVNVIEEREECTLVEIGAGVEWADFVDWSLNRSLWGCENLIGIPGLVGAAPVQNIGAFGQDVSKIIKSVYVYDIENKQSKTIDNKGCSFGFRRSIFNSSYKGRYIILSVLFSLSKEPVPITTRGELRKFRVAPVSDTSLQRKISEHVADIRRKKGMYYTTAESGSCGTFFKTIVLDDPSVLLKVSKNCIVSGKLLLLIKILLFAAKYKSGRVFRLPSRIILEELFPSGLSVGGFSLMKGNPAAVLSNKKMELKPDDVERLINIVQQKSMQLLDIELPVEPELIFGERKE